MSFNDYDKSTKPKVANEDLEQAKFIKTLANEIAVRIANSPSSPLNTVSGLSVPKHDKVVAAYPNATTEEYTYSLATVDICLITVVYTDSSKTDLTSVTKTDL